MSTVEKLKSNRQRTSAHAHTLNHRLYTFQFLFEEIELARQTLPPTLKSLIPISPVAITAIRPCLPDLARILINARDIAAVRHLEIPADQTQDRVDFCRYGCKSGRDEVRDVVLDGQGDQGKEVAVGDAVLDCPLLAGCSAKTCDTTEILLGSFISCESWNDVGRGTRKGWDKPVI